MAATSTRIKPATSFDEAVAHLAAKYPHVNVDVIEIVVRAHGVDNLMAAHEELGTNCGVPPAPSEPAHRRRVRRQRKSKDSSKRSRKSKHKTRKRKVDKRAEVSKAERKLLESLRASLRADGVSDDQFAALMETDAVNKRVRAEDTVEIVVMNEPRPGKKLLVLDMDYTLFDFRSESADIGSLKRPGLDALLAAVYPFYDLVVWSQSHWRRLEQILTALGLLTSEAFALSFVIDGRACHRASRFDDAGQIVVHEIKDLHLIWGRFPQYNPCNTIMIDDLERNFALNPANGLVIPPYTAELRLSGTDTACALLRGYLLTIRDEADLTALDHRRWAEVGAAYRSPSASKSADSSFSEFSFSVSSLDSED